MVTETEAVAKLHVDGKKICTRYLVRNSALGSTVVPVREGSGTKQAVVHHPVSLAVNQITPGTYPWYCMYPRKKEEEKGRKGKGKGEKTKMEKKERYKGKRKEEKLNMI